MREFMTIPAGGRINGRKLLGSGGQGEVWLGQADGRDVAVKVYHQHTATSAQRACIERLIDKGPPAPCFLWPLKLVEDRDTGTYGYIMELRAARFRSLEDFMARRVVPTFRALLTAAWQLADGFLRLHSLGLCYRDISFANVFFDPVDGDVRICDNDNVDVTGTTAGGILGTPRFMAPEVVRREALPSAETDRFSLAVLLFHMLMGGHPLDGEREARIRCLDIPALEKLYGFEPLYIFDPGDASNRPRKGVHDNPLAFHALYPRAVREHFERSFTEGMHYPTKRVRESEWRKLFARVVDGIVPCACSAENFYDADTYQGQGAGACWSCKRALALPPRMRVDEHVIVLSRDAKLRGHHLGSSDDAAPVADISQHPTNPSQLGLRNLTTAAWTLTRPDGIVVDVPPGRSAAIIAGNKINFGTVTGEIRD
ncbi:MAG: protein kinase [Myxococcales bacterium]|jgi:DNA-binding helix-hairpin-helix protein with protein kinase domain|nr:protein kinase [Myxococcales bacterium]MBK7192664.1 protein kinase [Myxococcales bacterium]